MAKKRESWRSLDSIEIALIKRMRSDRLPRDQIMSFFVRPGRIISPAALSEVEKARPDIEPASAAEVQQYMDRRLAETAVTRPYQGFGPVSELRSREVLQIARDGQRALPGVESYFAEFKRDLPNDRATYAKSARVMASFANHQGGYIFFGVQDDGTIPGIDPSAQLDATWDSLDDIVRRFSPFFQWERGLIDVSDRIVAVCYTHQAENRPIVCSSDCGSEIHEGDIYFRYGRSSRRICAADLHLMLQERDSRARGGVS